MTDDRKPFTLEVQREELDEGPRRRAEPEPKPPRPPAGRRPTEVQHQGPRKPYNAEEHMAQAREEGRKMRALRFERWGINPNAADAEEQYRAELARRQVLLGEGWTFADGVQERMSDWVARRDDAAARAAHEAALRAGAQKAAEDARRDARQRRLAGKPARSWTDD